MIRWTTIERKNRKKKNEEIIIDKEGTIKSTKHSIRKIKTYQLPLINAMKLGSFYVLNFIG